MPVCAYKNLALFWLYLLVKQLKRHTLFQKKYLSLELCTKLKSPHPFLNYLNYLSSSRITINLIKITTVCFSYTFTNTHIYSMYMHTYSYVHINIHVNKKNTIPRAYLLIFSLNNKSFIIFNRYCSSSYFFTATYSNLSKFLF